MQLYNTHTLTQHTQLSTPSIYIYTHTTTTTLNQQIELQLLYYYLSFKKLSTKKPKILL